MGIKIKISAIISLLFGALLTATAGLFVHLGTENIRQSITTQQAALVKTLAYGFDQQVQARHKALINIAEGLPRELLGDPPQLQSFLQKQIMLPKLFTNILVYGADGTVLAASPSPEKYVGSKRLAGMEYIVHTLDSRQPYISKLFVSPISGEPLIVMTAPVLDRNGQVLAILGGSQYIRRDNLFSGFTEAGVGKTGFLGLYTRERVIIANTDKSRLMEQLAPGANPAVDLALETSRFSGETVSAKGVPGLMTIETMQTTGWLAGAFLPLTEAYEPITLMRHHAIRVVAILLLMVPALVWLTMSFLTRPLLSLRDRISQMAAAPQGGGLIGLQRRDEIGELAQAFDKLTLARGRAEEQLRSASLYARSLIEASPDPLVTISAEGKITDVNEATVRVTGVSRERLIGSDFSDYFTEPDRARAGYQQVFAEGSVTDYSLTIRHRDGSLTDVLYNASLYKDEAGKVLGVFAAARDVTESRRVLREFTETKNFLDNILQSSTKYSIIGKDLDHRILSWNEGARRNYGYAAEEIIGKDSAILHVPEDVQSGAAERLFAIAHERGLAEGEFLRVRKDGSRFVANVVLTRRDDTSGSPIGYLLISSDITEKKQADEQLRSASLYARSLIEASLDPLVTISAEGKITDVNEATVRVTGRTRHQLIGSDFSDNFTEPERARAGYREVFAKGFVMDYPLTIRHVSGGVTDVLYNASVYCDEKGDVAGVFAAARDISQRKKAEAELQRHREHLEDLVAERTEALEAANRELEAFSYSVSHDLRAPLRAIDGFSQILVNKYGDQLDGEARRLIKVVRGNTVRMAQLIDDMLAFSRCGRLELRATLVDMGALVQSVWMDLEPARAGRDIRFVVHPLEPAKGDQAMLRQVWTNLLANAIKFTQPRTVAHVEVGAVVEGSEYFYTVKDDGVGFEPAYAGKLFGVFQRLHGIDEFEGTGIGLAIVKRVINRHGGRVMGESEVGKGATFRFSLPPAGTYSGPIEHDDRAIGGRPT